ILALGEEEGAIGKEEKEMIHGILKLDDKATYQIMTPRNEVFSLEMHRRVNDVISEVLESGFSRIPVYDKKPGNIKGIIYAKDLIKYLYENRNPKLSEISKEPFSIPELKMIDDLLTEFKKTKVHIAIVIDEHGDVSGIVTIEDLLEEIVGEIYDETDKEEFILKKVSDKVYIVSGKADIEDIADKTGISLKGIDLTAFETVNGLIMYKTGKIPKKGDRILFKRFYIEVLNHDQNMVTKAKIVKKA
ncbi:HlyC/CorC family transporter, partial [Candidatus Woesearchaeota archaeon]|nr:HlyC/CorC family transporter [Candidatus Woesearchaeota archaeon]